MMTTRRLPAYEQEIDEALQQNLRSLGEAFADLLAALLLVLICACSLVHAALRIVFAVAGLLLWVVALLLTLLYWLRAWSVRRSSVTTHRR